MPAEACTNHAKTVTYVRCGRCERPFCVQCLVDTPVGKKCRECARSRTHLSESTPRQVGLAFLAAAVVAVPAGWLMHFIPLLLLGPFLYGALVGEVALRAGQRRRSTAMQIATGLAAFVGGVVGGLLRFSPFLAALSMGAGVPLEARDGISWEIFLAFVGWPLVEIVIGVAVAVSRIRYL